MRQPGVYRTCVPLFYPILSFSQPQVWESFTSTFDAKCDQQLNRFHRLIQRFCSEADIVKAGTNKSTNSLHYFVTRDFPAGTTNNSELEVYSQLHETNVEKESILNFMLITIDHACDLDRSVIKANTWEELADMKVCDRFAFRVMKASFMRLLAESDFYVTLKTSVV